MRLGLADLPAADLEWIVESVQERADDLRGCTFLVTGASGFVGRWIVASLIEIRRQFNIPTMKVYVLIRDPVTAKGRLGSSLWGELDLVQADINDPWSLEYPVTHVIHGATPSSLRSGSGENRRVLLTSVLGTTNLIQAIGARGHPPRVLHMSSGAVYGPQPLDIERIPETWLGGPSPFMSTSPYAEGKRAAEALLEDAGREGLVVPVQARLFAFLGPGLPTDEGFAIGNFISQASRGEKISVNGDGTTVRSYLDAKEMALWLLLLSIDGQAGTPYNVGSPDGHALRYWAEMCAALAGVEVTFGEQAVGERPAYVPDIANSGTLAMRPESTDPEPALASWMSWLRQTAPHEAGS
jgi:nucleoside-diphosphate-sugar epimerase